MRKYYIGLGDMDLTASNALTECRSLEEAESTLKEIREEDREVPPDEYFAYYIDYTRMGAVRKKGRI